MEADSKQYHFESIDRIADYWNSKRLSVHSNNFPLLGQSSSTMSTSYHVCIVRVRQGEGQGQREINNNPNQKQNKIKLLLRG